MSISTIPDFEYHVPTSVGEVLTLLDTYGDQCRILNGGTDVIPKMKGGVFAPPHVISLKAVADLNYIKYDEQNGLCFGAATKIMDVENNPIVREKYPALYDGTHCIASTQIRNAGTIVGNICNAVPSADSAPPLLALGAKVKIQSVNGERIVPIEEFFVHVCSTVVKDNELVTEIQIPAPAANSSSVYYKYSVRKALDLAMVGVAASVTMDGDVCKDVKIALGAVSITPKRALQAEEMLRGQKLTDEIIAEVAKFASQNECSPITDMRATKEYRREMVRLLVRDAINEASGRKEIITAKTIAEHK